MNLSDLAAAVIVHRQQVIARDESIQAREKEVSRVEHPLVIARHLAGFREIGQGMANVVFKRDRMVV